MPFFVYILQNRSGAFYASQINILQNRLERHDGDRIKATRNKDPYFEECATKAEVKKACQEFLERYGTKTMVFKLAG